LNRSRTASALFARLSLAIALLIVTLGSARAQPPETASPTSPDTARFIGKTVSRVDVIVDDDTWSDVTPPEVTTVKAGEIFTPAVARRALSEVLATGKFAQGRVAIAVEGTGVRIVVHVVARKIIEVLTIDTHGAAVERDEITRESDLIEGGEIIGVDLPEQKEKVVDLLVRHGYPRAEVSITTRATDDRQRVLVFVDVQAGVPRLLDKRVFYISDPEARTLEELAIREYAVGKNERADEILLDAADTKLEALLRSRGYHRAEVSHDVIRWQGQVTLRVRIDTGPLFVARFEGNDHYDSTALEGALDLENETDRSPAHLVQKLKDFYAKRGWLDAEVTIEPRGGERDRVHVLMFKIAEHPRVLVSIRAYPCLNEEDIKRLSGGGPSSASKIGNEIDSFLEEELPGADIVKDPNPRGLDRTIGTGSAEVLTGARPVPVELEPNTTYVADTYERALLHVQELYRNEGFLHAQVGPAQIVRRRCSKRSPAGRCLPIQPTSRASDVCTYDATNLPLPVPPIDPALSCTPDPLHGVECEPRIELRIPIKLGPRTTLYDVSFTGVRSFSEERVAAAANVGLGDPVNTLRLDDARRRILDMYREEGYAYADVKYALEPSRDHTRARARFEITEGDQVTVREIVIRGNRLTNERTIRGRIALEIGKPFRTSDIRKTQERVATLNVFSSVTVGLAEQYVPQRSKVVVITVVEMPPKVVEQQAGFMTGEGFYYGFEYGFRNLGGNAIGLSLRGRLSYLPTAVFDILNLDPQVKKNWAGDPNDHTHYPGLDLIERIAGRITLSLALPEIGLGPLVRAQGDAVFLHDLQRDFYISKAAAIPSIQYRPVRQLLFTIGPSVEYNYLKLFQASDLVDYLRGQASLRGGNASPDVVKYLLFPDGASAATAQRVVFSWDRRDDSFNATRGTYFVSGLEHVDSYPLERRADNLTTFEGHFLHFTETFAGYIPLPMRMRLAGQLRLGTNVQLTSTSQTYPDRLFFMGGPDSMRGWSLRSFMPQDDIDQIAADSGKPDCVSANGDPAVCGTNGASINREKFTQTSNPIRGGNLMINPRIELRIPIVGFLETAVFSDIGNLWTHPSYPFATGKFPVRASVGMGARFQTPVGPVAVDYGLNLSELRARVTEIPHVREDLGALHFAIGLF